VVYNGGSGAVGPVAGSAGGPGVELASKGRGAEGAVVEATGGVAVEAAGEAAVEAAGGTVVKDVGGAAVDGAGGAVAGCLRTYS
jgi:hypothetical protein